jgi:hypothetical protein
MADFCAECAPIMWGEGVEPDIDIDGIFEDLQPDTGLSVICEGCGLVTVGKTNNGEMKLAVLTNNKLNWMSFEDFQSIKRINI